MLLLERQTPRFSSSSQHHGAPMHEQAGQACNSKLHDRPSLGEKEGAFNAHRRT